MSYRALYLADLHLDNRLPHSVRDPDTLVTDRFRDVLAVLEQMGAYAKANDIADIWVVGDLLDKRLIDAVTLKLAVEAVHELGQHHRVVLIPGNHEAHDASCRHYTLEGFAGLGEVPVILGDGEWYDTPHGPRVFALPFLPESRATAALQAVLDGPDKPDLLLVHQTIIGAQAGKWAASDGLDPHLIAAVSPVTLCGHFHTPQSITGTNAVIKYLGAPVQHNFGDSGEVRGFHDIMISGDGGPVAGTAVLVEGAPRFHELYWETSGEPPDISEILQGDYVNIHVRGPKSAVDKLMKDAGAFCEQLVTSGVRYAKPKPLPDAGPTRQRIAATQAGERPSLDESISRYLEAADCTGLNRQHLTALAKELVTDAEQ